MRSPSSSEVEVPFSARFHLGRSGRNPDGRLIGGLRMSRHPQPPFSHTPVMLDEVVDLFGPVPAGVVLDATLGAGGHARAILDAHPHLRVIGLDQDPAAVSAALTTLTGFGDRATVRRARFDRLGDVLDEEGVERVSGALFDLGVSSPQFDQPERGFSYRADAPLDMRMDPDGARTAADVVNDSSAEELTRLLVANGEGRFARRITRAIFAARPIHTTRELAEVIRSAIPAAARTIFFAKFSLSAVRLVIIASILFLRFAPVTPATHGNGDSRYSSQILRMPSAYASGSLPIRSTSSSQARSHSSIRRAPSHQTRG